jgi:hypothetical protein
VGRPLLLRHFATLAGYLRAPAKFRTPLKPEARFLDFRSPRTESRTVRIASSLVAFSLLAAMPVLAQVRGAPNAVATVSPPLGAVSSNSNGCSPANPCAIATPALGGAVMPVAEPAPQSSPSAAAPSAAAATAPAPAGRGAQADCPTPGAGRGFGRGPGQQGQGRGDFAGRGGEGRGAFAGRGEGRGAFAGRGEGRGQGAGRAGFTGRGPGGGFPPNCLPGRGPGQPGRGNPPAAAPR